MSIVQKSPTTTWLPRFWRKPDAIPLEEACADAPPRPAARIDPRPLDDRLENGHSVSKIHKLACVDPKAVIEDDVEIGPFCVVGPNVRLGRGTRLMNNATVIGHTTLGENNLVFPNAVLGAQPQDKKFNGETTRLEIGANNHFREAVTIHIGTAKGGGLTKIGSGNLLMVNCHIGHDVLIGDNCIMANNVMLAGHVHVGNSVVLSGCVGIHHFVTVGDYAYSAGMCKLTHDVPPFVKVDEKDRVRAVNTVGMRRNGFGEDDITAVEQAIWRLFLDRDREPVNTTIAKFRGGAYPELAANINVVKVLDFLDRRNLGRHGRYLESLRAG